MTAWGMAACKRFATPVVVKEFSHETSTLLARIYLYATPEHPRLRQSGYERLLHRGLSVLLLSPVLLLDLLLTLISYFQLTSDILSGMVMITEYPLSKVFSGYYYQITRHGYLDRTSHGKSYS